jgi:hypothetical protein
VRRASKGEIIEGDNSLNLAGQIFQATGTEIQTLKAGVIWRMARLRIASDLPAMIYQESPVSDRQLSPRPVVLLSVIHLFCYVNDL